MISCCVIWTLSHKLWGVMEGLWVGAIDVYSSYPLRWKHSFCSVPVGEWIKASLTQAPLSQMPLQNHLTVHLSYSLLSVLKSMVFWTLSGMCCSPLILQTHLDTLSSLSDFSFLLSYKLLDFSVICRLK